MFVLYVCIIQFWFKYFILHQKSHLVLIVNNQFLQNTTPNYIISAILNECIHFLLNKKG